MHSGPRVQSPSQSPSAEPSGEGCSGCLRACVAQIPAVTRLLMISTLVLWLFAIVLPSVAYHTYLHPPTLFSFPYLFYTIFISELFDSYSFLSGLLCAMFLYFACGQLESQRGSIWILHAFFVCSWLANLLFIVLQTLLYYGFDWSFAYDFVSAGPLPAVFAFLAIRADTSLDPNTPCCGSCTVPTKLHPWILLTIFVLLNQRIDILAGCLVGYLYIRKDQFQLKDETIRRLESGGNSIVTWLSRRERFVSLQAAQSGAMVMNSPFAPRQQRMEDEESGEGGMQGVAQSQVDSRAVFQSGGGHRLGSRNDSTPAPQQYRPNPTGANAGAPSPAEARALEEARRKRLEAAERRLVRENQSQGQSQSQDQNQSQPLSQFGAPAAMELSSRVPTASPVRPSSATAIAVPDYRDDPDDDENERLLSAQVQRSASRSFSPEFSSSLLHSTDVPEHLVLRLTALGHSRERAIRALQQTENDWVQAAKMLKESN